MTTLKFTTIYNPKQNLLNDRNVAKYILDCWNKVTDKIGTDYRNKLGDSALTNLEFLKNAMIIGYCKVDWDNFFKAYDNCYQNYSEFRKICEVLENEVVDLKSIHPTAENKIAQMVKEANKAKGMSPS